MDVECQPGHICFKWMICKVVCIVIYDIKKKEIGSILPESNNLLKYDNDIFNQEIWNKNDVPNCNKQEFMPEQFNVLIQNIRGEIDNVKNNEFNIDNVKNLNDKQMPSTNDIIIKKKKTVIVKGKSVNNSKFNDENMLD